jgi:uroporphyrinogen-III decarboxylase
MTGREIAQMAFELRKPPRVPVTLIGGGAWAVHHSGKTFGQIIHDPQQIADVFIQFHRRFRNDLLWTGSNFLNYPIHFLGCPVKDDSSDGPALEGSVIKNLDELDKLSIAKVVRNPTMKGIIRSHHLTADAVGRETLIIPTQWAPLTLAARILGVQATMMATISDPVASGDLISPSMFRKFSAPALKDLVGRVKSKGKLSMIHICGDSTHILPDILDIGPHCFSLENKVDLGAAREVLGGKVCVAGNVSPTGAFLSGKPEEVLEEARACLAAWGDEGGYILTVGCDFSKNVPLENMLALMSFRERAEG